MTVPLLQRVLSVNHAPNVSLVGLRLAHSTIQCPALDRKGDGYTTCDDEFTGPSAKSTAKGAGVGELLFANNASGLVLRNISAGSSGGNALSVASSAHVVVERRGHQCICSRGARAARLLRAAHCPKQLCRPQ